MRERDPITFVFGFLNFFKFFVTVLGPPPKKKSAPPLILLRINFSGVIYLMKKFENQNSAKGALWRHSINN